MPVNAAAGSSLLQFFVSPPGHLAGLGFPAGADHMGDIIRELAR